MIKKRNIILLSLCGTVVLLIALFSKQIGLCPAFSYSDCSKIADTIAVVFFPFAFFFILATITYFMREEVYRAWVQIALWLLGISMILIVITPEARSGGFGPQISFDKFDVALLVSSVFTIASAAVIVWKYARLRK